MKQRCSTPGCFSVLHRTNTSGVCRQHFHNQHCGCRSCSEKRESGKPRVTRMRGSSHVLFLRVPPDMMSEIEDYTNREATTFSKAALDLIEWGLETAKVHL